MTEESSGIAKYIPRGGGGTQPFNLAPQDLPRRLAPLLLTVGKRDLKSPTFVRDLRGIVISQFEIIVATGFAKSFALDWEKSA